MPFPISECGSRPRLSSKYLLPLGLRLNHFGSSNVEGENNGLSGFLNFGWGSKHILKSLAHLFFSRFHVLSSFATEQQSIVNQIHLKPKSS